MVPLPAWKDLLRRIDQSAIYVKIAGSYTPVRGADRHPRRPVPDRRLGRGAGRGVDDPASARRGCSWASIVLYLGDRLGRALAGAAAARRAHARPASRWSWSAAPSTPPGCCSSSGSGCRSTTPSGTSSCWRRASLLYAAVLVELCGRARRLIGAAGRRTSCCATRRDLRPALHRSARPDRPGGAGTAAGGAGERR